MLEIQRFEPFYKKRDGDELKIVFAYQYFSIIQDDEIFHFIPIDATDIKINLKTLQIDNLNDVFVFQRGSEFIRVPLYQLVLTSDLHDHIQRILTESNFEVEIKSSKEYLKTETEELIDVMVELNRQHEIDRALDQRNEELFRQLVKED